MTLDDIAALRTLLERASHLPWHPPHYGDDSCKCDCKSGVNQGYAGAIYTIHTDNGLRIRDGGNDAPPAHEAAANGQLIAAAVNALPRLLDIAERAIITV
jgi:hypothetical protein